MADTRRTTGHHFGPAHRVKGEPTGAPRNYSAHTHARVPLPPLLRSVGQWTAIRSCSEGAACPILEPFRAKKPLGIDGDAELTGKPVGFALSRAESLRTASNNGVDVLSQWANGRSRSGIGLSHVFAALPAPSANDERNVCRHGKAFGT